MNVVEFLHDYMDGNVMIVELKKMPDKKIENKFDVESKDKGVMSIADVYANYRYKEVSSYRTGVFIDKIDDQDIIRPCIKLYVKMWRDK